MVHRLLGSVGCAEFTNSLTSLIHKVSSSVLRLVMDVSVEAIPVLLSEGPTGSKQDTSATGSKQDTSAISIREQVRTLP